ncbi:tetratricopeptide repeat protein [Geomonas oryzae]|uniref:tetratricopeptide repeat protein n=1 Tax=Geomonas oryzae TaxID=2364273 RepID=UPI00100C190C|nr:tetratricopeptide repeat protein [Geomonas oryzae]
MTRNISLLVLACFILSGCANNVWFRDNTSAEQGRKDFNECKYDSNKSSFVPFGDGRSPISAGIQEGFQSADLMSQCMRARGYYLVNRYELQEKRNRNKKLYDSYIEAMTNKKYTEALIIVDSALLANPTSYDWYYRKAEVNYGLGEYTDAIKATSKSIELGNKNANVYSLKANCFCSLAEYDIAIETANEGLKLNNNAHLYNVRGYAYNMKNEFDKALNDCNKAISIDASLCNVYKNRGLAYAGMGEYDKAIDQFNKSIMLNSNYPLSYLGRGDTYMKLGKVDSALADYKKACELGDKMACSKMK